MTIKHDKRFDEMHDFDLNGVEVLYPHLFEKDTAFNKDEWNVIVLLPEPLATQMKEVGFNVRTKDFGNGPVKCITAKRKGRKQDGSPMFPPRIYDAGTATTKPKLWDPNVAIGNGSIMNLKCQATYREVGGKVHLPLYLNSGQVVKFVEYTSSPFDSVDPETGSTF